MKLPDLNQGPASYEGGRIPSYPISISRYEHYDKGVKPKKLLDYVEFRWGNACVSEPLVNREISSFAVWDNKGMAPRWRTESVFTTPSKIFPTFPKKAYSPCSNKRAISSLLTLPFATSMTRFSNTSSLNKIGTPLALKNK